MVYPFADIISWSRSVFLRILPKHLVRTLALEGKIKAVRVSNSPNAKILVNIQSLNDYFNSAVIGTVEPETKVGGIQPIPVKL